MKTGIIVAGVLFLILLVILGLYYKNRVVVFEVDELFAITEEHQSAIPVGLYTWLYSHSDPSLILKLNQSGTISGQLGNGTPIKGDTLIKSIDVSENIIETGSMADFAWKARIGLTVDPVSLGIPSDYTPSLELDGLVFKGLLTISKSFIDWISNPL